MTDRTHLKFAAVIWTACGFATYQFADFHGLGLLELAFGGSCYIAAFFADRGRAA